MCPRLCGLGRCSGGHRSSSCTLLERAPSLLSPCSPLLLPPVLGHWPHFTAPRALSHPQLRQQSVHLLVEIRATPTPFRCLCSSVWFLRRSLGCCLPVLILRSLLQSSSSHCSSFSTEDEPSVHTLPFPSDCDSLIRGGKDLADSLHTLQP